MSLNIDFPNICKMLNDHEKMLIKYNQSQNFCIPVVKVLSYTIGSMGLILGQGTKILIKISDLKRTQSDGETYCVHGLEESILSKWLFYPKQSIDSMQSLSSYQGYFSQN